MTFSRRLAPVSFLWPWAAACAGCALWGCTSGPTGPGGADGGTPAGDMTVAMAPPPVSSPWSFEHPLPQGNALYGVWAAGSGTEAWAVGAAGAIVHVQGQQATRVGAGVTQAALRAVTVAGGDVWAVGDGGTVVWGHGGSFTAQLAGAGALYAVWIAGGMVSATGEGGVVWSAPAQGGPFASAVLPGLPDGGVVRGAAATPGGDVFLVGSGGRILHQQAGRWVIEGDGLTTLDLMSVTVAADAIYAAGQGGRVLRRDPMTGRWAVEHPTQTTTLTRADLGAVFTAAGQVYALGTDGTLLDRGAAGWELSTTVPGFTLTRLHAGAGGSGGGFLVGDAGTVLFRGTGAADPFTPAVKGGQLTRADLLAAAAGDTAAYAVTGEGQVLRRTVAAGAATWTVDYTPARPPGQPLLGVTVRADEVFAVGMGGVVLHRTAAGWQQEAVSFPMRQPDLKAVWARPGSADVFAVGSAATANAPEEGVILRRSGGSWTREMTDHLLTSGLYAVTGTDTDTLAAGTQGAIVRRLSTGTWTREDGAIALDVEILGMTAMGKQVVAVGTRGTVLTRSVDMNGNPTWARKSLGGVNGTLNAVVAGPMDVWAVGAGGVAARQHAGADWQVEPTLFAGDLFGIGQAGADVLAAGAGGAVLHRGQ